VVSNLLRNARDAVVQGGTVRIATANAQQGIVLEVSDTGCGIEPGDLARIFDAFEHARTNPEERGLGLGLSISKSLVEAHGGRIHAWSAGPERGATFEVVLPSLPAEAVVRAPPPPRDTHPVELPALRILLVDDHQDTAESLAMLLRQRGFDVVVAYSMASALDKATSGFDVLISDLGLPDGSGRELAERLAAAGPIRAIALSGYGGEADVAASRAAGFRAHLVKPVEPARLLRVIERVSAA
jgi:CheY-like chemotaxis protein